MPVVCKCVKTQLNNINRFSPFGISWEDTSYTDYDTACRACETDVIVTAMHKRRIAKLLVYDKRSRKPSSFGRALSRDYPPLGLLAGDRLEPSPYLGDVAKFEGLPANATVRFWRVKLQSRVIHRNPLFDPTLGLSHQSCAVDKLHTVYLGVLQSWLLRVLWLLIDIHAFGIVGTNEVMNGNLNH